MRDAAITLCNTYKVINIYIGYKIKVMLRVCYKYIVCKAMKRYPCKGI